MFNTIGNIKDLDAIRREALQGLLSSLGHPNDDPIPVATLSAEQRRNFSENISENLGGDADSDRILGGQPSQLVNEDGLPIIDISEPVADDSQTSISSSPFLEQDTTPSNLLQPDERERQRRERDHILDLLEEEERLQQLQEEQNAKEEQKEAIREHKESAKAELDRLKAARELQKKMGQALIRHAKEGEGDRREGKAGPSPQVISPVAQKSVSFADASVMNAVKRDQQTSIPQLDWGDVTPGRLRAQSCIPPVSTAEAQKFPVKMRVVERRPTAILASPSHNDADSDDGSASAGYLSSRMESVSSDEEGRSSSSNDGSSDGEPLEEGFDYDTAQHHREIALGYHEKRHAIGVETAGAMAAHALHEHEQHKTFQSSRQLPLSRFRADRMTAAYDSSYGPIATSIGQADFPASRRRSLRSSVRLGKLENGRLVGGDSGESGSEDETIKQVIQMLRTGSIQNAGPDSKPSSMPTITPPRVFNTVESPSAGTSITGHGAKSSRFRLARGGITKATTFHDNKSWVNARSQPTISGVVERETPRA